MQVSHPLVRSSLVLQPRPPLRLLRNARPWLLRLLSPLLNRLQRLLLSRQLQLLQHHRQHRSRSSRHLHLLSYQQLSRPQHQRLKHLLLLRLQHHPHDASSCRKRVHGLFIPLRPMPQAPRLATVQSSSGHARRLQERPATVRRFLQERVGPCIPLAASPAAQVAPVDQAAVQASVVPVAVQALVGRVPEASADRVPELQDCFLRDRLRLLPAVRRVVPHHVVAAISVTRRAKKAR